MQNNYTYETPLISEATVTDRFGKESGILVNDGQQILLDFRGKRYDGSCLDGWEATEDSSPLEGDTAPGDTGLTGFTLRWSLPLHAVVDHEPQAIEVVAELSVPENDGTSGVQRDGASVSLATELSGGVYRTEPAGSMEEAVLELGSKVPGHVEIRTCTTCALSDFPVAGNGFMGGLGCFRNAKERKRNAVSKWDMIHLWDEVEYGMVQETFYCEEFES